MDFDNMWKMMGSTSQLSKCRKRIEYMQGLVGDKRMEQLSKTYESLCDMHKYSPDEWKRYIKGLNDLRNNLEMMKFHKDCNTLIKKVEDDKNNMLSAIKLSVDTEKNVGILKLIALEEKCHEALGYMLDWKNAKAVDHICLEKIEKLKEDKIAIEKNAKEAGYPITLTSQNEIKAYTSLSKYANSQMKLCMKRKRENPEGLKSVYKLLDSFRWWNGVEDLMKICCSNYEQLTGEKLEELL